MTAFRFVNDLDFRATEINWSERERGIGTGHMIVPAQMNANIGEVDNGTCSTTVGTPNITASGENWTDTLAPGDIFVVESGVDAGTYTVVTVTNDNNIVTNASPNFTGSAGVAYTGYIPYYALQEEKIYLKNHLGEIVYRGWITNDSAATNGIRLDFESIPGMLKQRINKRDYKLHKGMIGKAKDDDGFYIVDPTATFSTDQWNNYGITIAPSPIARSPEAVVSWRNTGGIVPIVGQAVQKPIEYRGWGFGDKHDLLGYGVGVNQTNGRLSSRYPGYDWYTAEPVATDNIAERLADDAIFATRAECIRAEWDTSTDHSSWGAWKPTLDLYFNMMDVPLSDVVGLKIRVQASIRNADQTNGIHMHLFNQNQTYQDERGTWEDLSDVDHTNVSITEVDANNDGAWGVWEFKFELSGGIDEDYVNLDEAKPVAPVTGSTVGYDGSSKNVIRLCIQGEDDLNQDVGRGINVGSVKVWLIRQGSDTNQYKITDTVAPARLTLDTDPTDYAASKDTYVIAPSVNIVWDDFDDATYGASDYPFEFNSSLLTGAADEFISMKFRGQYHYDILETLCDFGNHTWWFRPDLGASFGRLIFAEDDDYTDSTLAMNANYFPPGSATLMYPQTNIIGKIIATGNPTLGVTYTKTGTSDGTREVYLDFPHVSSYAELKKFADNLFNKWALRKPLFSTTIDYRTYGADVNKIRPGYTIDVSYKNLTSTALPVRRIEVTWKEGEHATLFIEASEMGTPPDEKIGDTVAKMRYRMNRYIGEGRIENENDVVKRQLSEGRLNINDPFPPIDSSGNTPLMEDWYTGEAITVTTDTIALSNPTGTDPSMTAYDSVDEVISFSDEIALWKAEYRQGLAGGSSYVEAVDDAAGAILGVTADVEIQEGYHLDADGMIVRDGLTTGITFEEGINDMVIYKYNNLAELEFFGDIVVDTGTFSATTVYIGDQVIGEDGELTITDPITPGLKIIDSGASGTASRGYVYFLDSLLAHQAYIQNEPNGELRIRNQVGKITLQSKTGNDIELGSSAYSENARVHNHFIPMVNNTSDLGSVANEFKDLFLVGTAHIDTLDVDDTATITTSIQVAGGAVITTLGDTATLANSDVKIPTNTTVKEYCDTHLMIGSGNATFWPCLFKFDSLNSAVRTINSSGLVSNVGAADPAWYYELTLPTNKGGLKLYITKLRVGLYDSDANDFPFNVYVQGVDYNSITNITGSPFATQDSGDSWGETSPGVWPGQVEQTKTFSSAQDMSGYRKVLVWLNNSTTGANELDEASVELECYYGA
jgi:hypothetical protein